jgi:hypothetical protein
MIHLDVEFKAKLAKILKDGELSKRFSKGINDSKYIVEGEYRKEAPVDKSLLRQLISSKDVAGGFITTTTAKSAGGKPYPLYISQGTGKFKGDPDGGYTTGLVRARGGYTDKEIIMFKAMRKRGVEMSIRPNKFAVRAERNSKNTVTEVFILLVDKLSRELVNFK